MKLDLLLVGEPARKIAEIVRIAEGSGFSGIGVTDTGRSAFMGCMAVALSSRLHACTSIVPAFPVSPMVAAQMAWELSEVTCGRFRLGLGAQVEAHIVRRFSAAYQPPGPRLREYVQAMRAIFAAFGGEQLRFEGRFYTFTLLPSEWSPGASDYSSPPIDIAAVNPWMLRMAAEVADGVHVHPLNTPAYLRSVVEPNLRAGATRAGKDLASIHVTIPFFGVGGDTHEERQSARESARRRIAFYGSTPNYAFVFDDIGFPGTTALLQRHYRGRDWQSMYRVITDEILDQFVVAGPWDQLPDLLLERYGNIADRVALYSADLDLEHDRATIEHWGAVADALNM